MKLKDLWQILAIYDIRGKWKGEASVMISLYKSLVDILGKKKKNNTL